MQISKIAILLCGLFIVSCAPKKLITSKKEPPKIKSMKTENCKGDKVYTMGYWTVKKGEFVWVDGKCVRAKENMNFIPTHWEKKDGVYHLVEGRWVEFKSKDVTK